MKQSIARRPLDLIPMESPRTLAGLFRERAARTPEAIAYRQFNEKLGEWQSYTWRTMERRVARCQAALDAEDLESGDRVAIALPNSTEWVCFDQASLALGLVVVPLYITDSPENVSYILADSGARVLVVDTPDRWEALSPKRDSLPNLKRVVSLTALTGAKPGDDVLRHVDDWLPADATLMPDQVQDPEALATLVYTSGTTGRPKGVMLTHRNILWDVEAVAKRVPTYPGDVFLSFLPLAHAFERTAGYYLPMMAGSEVAYARSIDKLREDLLVIKPTVLLSVPRIYERVYLRLQDRLAGKALARRLFNLTVAVGWRRFKASQGLVSPPGFWYRLLWAVLRRLVANKVLARLGGRIRVAVSGGAPLSENLARIFIGLGLPLTEGYGLTEAAPVVSGNLPEDSIAGSVGKPLPGIEVRLAENNELLVRSPAVMQGYWRRPEDTRAAVTQEGWLHTGDLAEIDDDNIYLKGRLKEILVTATGEKVPPADMEMTLAMDPLIEQAMAIGDRRPYVAALLVLNRQAWAELATELDLDPDAPSSLTNPLAVDSVLARVKGLLRHFPGYAQVQAVSLTLETWTIDNGLLTPTMKLKRGELLERFTDQVDGLYRGHETPA